VFRVSSREIVDGARPNARAISRTPFPFPPSYSRAISARPVNSSRVQPTATSRNLGCQRKYQQKECCKRFWTTRCAKSEPVPRNARVPAMFVRFAVFAPGQMTTSKAALRYSDANPEQIVNPSGLLS
jgi:hypothetical protein